MIFKLKYYDKVLFFAVFASVICSYFTQYFFDLTPCRICLYQRYLWNTLLLVCFFNLKKPFKYKNLNIIIILLILFSIAVLSFYHSGVEMNLFGNIFSCATNNNIEASTIEELDQIIRNTKNNDCAFAKFYIFHLTLANLSFLLSIFLFGFSLKFYKRNIF